MQLLKARPDHITALYGLFPTLSHIALSQSGVRITRILNSFVISLTALLCYLIYLFVPFFVLSRVIGAATRIRNPYYRQTVTSFVSTPSCGPAALALATDEMKHIRELDAELLTSYADRVSLYYAERDGWVLDSSRAEVLKLLEGVDKDGKMLSRRMRCVLHAGEVTLLRRETGAKKGSCTLSR